MTTHQLSYKSQKSPTYPSVEWLEVGEAGILHECAIMKRDKNTGNVLFFKINDLDAIDKKRLVEILMDRNAKQFELFDIMSSRTLNNGVNALVYFSQLVKQLTPSGKILDPKLGQVGVSSMGTINTNKQ